jgi:Skp family chaperone for outer membrane proteins
MGVVVVALSLMTGTASAGFDKNPTSAIDDRRAMTQNAKEQTKLLKELLDETKKTNELLQKLVASGGAASNSRGRGEPGQPEQTEGISRGRR